MVFPALQNIWLIGYIKIIMFTAHCHLIVILVVSHTYKIYLNITYILAIVPMLVKYLNIVVLQITRNTHALINPKTDVSL